MTEIPIRILMVSTEYPPMEGGVGRYTFNLTEELRRIGFEVYIACNGRGRGQFFGLSVNNPQNSDVLLKIIEEVRPDIVHIQYEPGLYGLEMDPINPKNSSTNIDSFYERCKVPIVTTFHSAYTFRQWLSLIEPLELENFELMEKAGVLFHSLGELWTRVLNYRSFHKLNTKKLRKSQRSIVFSDYMLKMVGGGEVIYHGAEPSAAVFPGTTKKEARASFCLPQEGRIALALGFQTHTKGWDVLQKMKVPQGWTIVVSSSKNWYIKNNFSTRLNNDNIIMLPNGFLGESDLSTLLSASDAIILPYKVSSASGVMFDGLAHGLPFVASDLEFFKEFSDQGLGITVRRNPNEFSNALVRLANHYAKYKESVDAFKKKLTWETVAMQHVRVYSEITKKVVILENKKKEKTLSNDKM
jgi:glycosyltransferase involved in cell wall biosynthesis